MRVPNITNMLLGAMGILGAILGTVIHDDARDIVASVKEVSAKQSEDHAQIGVNSAHISSLEISDARQWDAIAKKADRLP